MNIVIGFIAGVICYWLLRIPAQSILNRNKNREIKVPSHPRALPGVQGKIPDSVNDKSSIEDKSQNIILRIQLNDSIIAFRKEDSPSINVNEYGRIIEIETNETNIIVGLNNIKSITYNPDECMTYYSD